MALGAFKEVFVINIAFVCIMYQDSEPMSGRQIYIDSDYYRQFVKTQSISGGHFKGNLVWSQCIRDRPI
jgi:hypothetical protein